MGKKPTASEAVAKAQQRNRDAGGGRLTINLTPEDMGKWEAVLDGFPAGRGQKMAAFRAMLESMLSQGETTKADVLAWIERMPD